MTLREERESFYNPTPYLPFMNFPGAPAWDRPQHPGAPARPQRPDTPACRFPPMSLREERERFYDPTPYPPFMNFPGAPAWGRAQPQRPDTPGRYQHPAAPAGLQRPAEPRLSFLALPPKTSVIPCESPTRELSRSMAESTIEIINAGYIRAYPPHDGAWQLDISSQLTAMCYGTEYYRPDSSRLDWKSSTRPMPPPSSGGTIIEVLNVSPIGGARHLQRRVGDAAIIGVLNFASPIKPGGDFLDGGKTQEALLTRSSTLYASLNCSTSKRFYGHHSPDNPFYSNAMIFSPHVALFRNDEGNLEHPLEINVVSSPPVNAVLARSMASGLRVSRTSTKVKEAMRERMGRILALFELQGAKYLVLGAFGAETCCKNDIEMIAELWANFFSVPGGRFSTSFKQVIFAIPKQPQFEKFRTVFQSKCHRGPHPARWRVL